MDNNLLLVVELQKVILAIGKMKNIVIEHPNRQAALDAELKAEEDKLSGEKASLDAAQKEKRKKEGELQLLNQKLEKYKEQLMAVKTNKEYTTMLHEIEVCKKEIDKFEEGLIQTMYDLDTLQVEVKKEEEICRQSRKRIEDEKMRASGEVTEAEKELGTLEARKAEIESTLPANILRDFNSIAEIRGGVAVARAEDFTCLECKLKLRPQIFIEVKGNNALITCDNCSRFLYWEEGLRSELSPKTNDNG